MDASWNLRVAQPEFLPHAHELRWDHQRDENVDQWPLQVDRFTISAGAAIHLAGGGNSAGDADLNRGEYRHGLLYARRLGPAPARRCIVAQSGAIWRAGD